MNKAELNDLKRTDNLPQMIQNVKEDTQKYWSLREVKKKSMPHPQAFVLCGPAARRRQVEVRPLQSPSYSGILNTAGGKSRACAHWVFLTSGGSHHI